MPAKPTKTPPSVLKQPAHETVFQNRFADNPQYWKYKSLRTREVLHLFGDTSLTPRQLQWWDERNFVSPKIEAHARAWTIEDCIVLGIIQVLRGHQFSLQRIRSFIAPIERHIRARDYVFPRFLVVKQKRRIIPADTAEDAVRELSTPEHAVLVNVWAIVERLDNRWENLWKARL